MSFGLSGADVEFMVRGAARRARKAGRAMNQGDLLDEITGKPRDPNSSVRLAPEEIERIAVHEAGHVLARCLSNSRGKDITFVSIVPRMNGALGFVAHAPSDRNVQTRKDYMEHLEIFLAGRAAEALQYGEDGVSSGARSDLIVATDVAKNMVSQFGLGPDGSLMWTDTPTAEHLAQAEKTLAQAYDSIKNKLRKNQTQLLLLADALKKHQELTGPQVLRIARLPGA
jgi:cell division protease FtsH